MVPREISRPDGGNFHPEILGEMESNLICAYICQMGW